MKHKRLLTRCERFPEFGGDADQVQEVRVRVRQRDQIGDREVRGHLDDDFWRKIQKFTFFSFFRHFCRKTDDQLNVECLKKRVGLIGRKRNKRFLKNFFSKIEMGKKRLDRGKK